MQTACRRLSAMATHVSQPLPRLYLGTMTFAWSQASEVVDDAVALGMTQKFLAAGFTDIDTARIYSGGDTETMLGRVLKNPLGKYSLATKVHPSQPGGLSAQGIQGQFEKSLKELGVDSVDVLYLHQPDPEHDLTESLAHVDSLVREGKVARIGLSNYSALETDRLCELCKEHGWTLPSFYQGLYNPLNRLAEEELLPVLRRHNIGFIAFNPLAAGLLSGKHSPTGTVISGRFKENPNYLPRFYTEANFAALDKIRAACAEHNLGMVPATYSWLLLHSSLDGSRGDGLLLGASSLAHLEENLGSCTDPKSLPTSVREAFDSAWDVCKDGAFPYWRSYSKDQPGREGLHPGASYNAAKTKT